MIIRAMRSLLLGLVMLLCVGSHAEIVTVANPLALPVIDQANILTREQEDSLSVRLRTLADTDGTQIAIVTVPTTGDEDIFSFSQRTFSDWKIGQAKENNGGLFVIAVNDHKMRIHTGYGLEGRLPDAICNRIISLEVAPEFRQGRYYEGISKGADAIIAAVKGEYKAPVEQPVNDNGMFYFILFLFILFFLWSVYSANRRGGGGGGSGMTRRGDGVMLPNIWTTGSGGGGGWGHSSGESSGGFGGFGGGFGGGSSGGGGASGSW